MLRSEAGSGTVDSGVDYMNRLAGEGCEDGGLADDRAAA
jgi:hypothetical protein